MGQMAELAKETNHEPEEVGQEEEEEEVRQSNGNFDCDQPEEFLWELNLMIVLFSLSSEDSSLNRPEKEIECFKRHKEKTCVPRLNSAKREMRHDKFAGKRSQRFHPITKDCRHGRRM